MEFMELEKVLVLDKQQSSNIGSSQSKKTVNGRALFRWWLYVIPRACVCTRSGRVHYNVTDSLIRRKGREGGREESESGVARSGSTNDQHLGQDTSPCWRETIPVKGSKTCVWVVPLGVLLRHSTEWRR
ncbi:uncharacterized protein LOC135165167 [Diachasmimorpha longicaudata]|uniref:uncharacterized protein LOC135165167 n=1 Tax=Diachasmimorpha longicaudata TaxID=58733 RepID=UPI0030B8DCE7